MAVPVTLKVYKGDSLVASRDFDRDIIKIGRLASAHLSLDDDKVSRIHSVIEVAADGSMSIIDMGSVEGTYVNGKRVNKGALAFGDEIRVGNTVIRIQEAAQNLAAAAAAAPAEDAPVPAGLDVAQTLGNAASVVASADAPPPPPSDALDPSFASTQQSQVLAPPEDLDATAGRAAVAAAEEPGRRARPQRRKGKGPLGLELRFMWGDQMVGSYLLQPGAKQSFSVGSAAGVNFVMGDARLGGPKFDVVVNDGQSFALRFTKKMKGELERDGEVVELSSLLESSKVSHDGDAYSLSLESDDFAWVDLGGVTLELFFQPVPKPVFVPISESLDFTVLNIFLVMFFLGALFVITAMNREAEGDDFADELNSPDGARIAKLIIKPPEVQKNPLLQKLEQQKAEKQSGEAAQKHKESEGVAGSKKSTDHNKHMAPQGDPNKKDQGRKIAEKLFSGGGLSAVFGNGGGGVLKAASGGLFGNAAGASAGLGGMGLRGSGSGGGGSGNTIGISGVQTQGRGGGSGSYGNAVGVLGGKKSVDIGITSSEPVVVGSLDKELIRQVIKQHIGQIRFCYESQLNRYPKLNGKVAIKFVIAATGAVASTSVAQSTVNNSELDQCVASRVHTWVFPKPKGGGVVIVTYPFIFKQAGE